MEIYNLMEVNTGFKPVIKKKKVLIASSCLRHKDDVFSGFSDAVILLACPERDHINVIGFKLLGLIIRCKPERVQVLTVDGSMHCVALHYIVEEVHKALNGLFQRDHYVYSRGEIVNIPEKAVKVSRYLSRITRLLSYPSRGDVGAKDDHEDSHGEH
ncbi:MAG TPA: 4Fe-4S ferredoxin [Thermoprotei archaeon]|nr:4Fe-4S ferredoxin [Thermoprotei archaeon]